MHKIAYKMGKIIVVDFWFLGDLNCTDAVNLMTRKKLIIKNLYHKASQESLFLSTHAIKLVKGLKVYNGFKNYIMMFRLLLQHSSAKNVND